MAIGEGKWTGYLRFLYQLNHDPSDGGYTPYEFKPVNMSMGRDWGRRESVTVIPGVDGVADGYGAAGGPIDRRDQTFSFRKFTNGQNDAEYDRLMAWIAPGKRIRLVYQADDGATLWYTPASDARLAHTLTSANSWGTGGYVDFAITWRIRPDWRPRFSETAQVFRTGSVFVAATTFGSLGTTVITTAIQPFTIDATGVAGVTLPTLPDRGPKVTVHGPVGGDGGFRVLNYTATTIDPSGAEAPTYFDVPFKLPASADTTILNFAAQIFTGDGVPFRPTKPSYQSEYFRIDPGVVNQCYFQALGGSVLTGGSIAVDWWRKRG